jgi:hypothetical protein
MEVKYTHMSNITKIAIRFALAASLGLGSLMAHNGEEHVNGTIAKISETSVTVNTTAGKMVEVAFEAKTAFTKSSQPIQKTDLKVGDRVVIHAGEVHEKLIAHTVQVGVAKAAEHGDHSATEHSKAEHAEHH